MVLICAMVNAANCVLVKLVKPGISTKDIDAQVEALIVSRGAASAFKGYRGFTGSICSSPNDMVVHGIPGPYKLADGDLIWRMREDQFAADARKMPSDFNAAVESLQATMSGILNAARTEAQWGAGRRVPVAPGCVPSGEAVGTLTLTASLREGQLLLRMRSPG